MRSSFDENKQRLNDQAAISSIDDRRNDIYDKNVEQMLINNVDNNEVEKVKLLAQLSAKVKDKRKLKMNLIKLLNQRLSELVSK